LDAALDAGLSGRMTIKLTAYTWVPDFARGLVREFRVRWALEEAGLAYEEWLLDQGDQKREDYLAFQPFGQVPAYQEDDLVLFESAAILLHIAEKSEALMPPDAHGRARVISWLFAAMNSVEPPIQALVGIDLFSANEEWAKLGRPAAVKAVQGRLDSLSHWLESRDYLEQGRFTVADLLMCTVLRILRHTDLVTSMPVLNAYVERCEARPAFKKALADHLAAFTGAPPAGWDR